MFYKSWAVIFSLVVMAACTGASEQELLAKAKAQIASGEYRAAVISLRNILQTNGQNMEARWLLGNQYLEAGDYPSAIKELERAAALGVAKDSVIVPLAQATLKMAQFDKVLAISGDGLAQSSKSELNAAQIAALLGKSELQKAKERLAAALAEDPDSIALGIERARVQLAEATPDEARATLQAIIKTAPEEYRAWRLLAEVERRTNNLKAAEDALTRVIQNRRDHETELLKRAHVRVSLAKYDDAQADLKQFRARNPSYFEADYIQGLIDYQNGRLDDAIEALNKAVAASPNFLPALSYLGIAQLRLGQFEQAANVLQRVVNSAPTSVQARKALARARLALEQYRSVIDLLKPVAEQFPEDASTLAMLANAYLARSALPEALALGERLVALDPESAVHQAALGSVLYRINDTAGALERLRLSVSLDPVGAVGREALVGVLVKEGEFDLAAAQAAEFVAAVPASPLGYILSAGVALARGDKRAAETSLTEALQRDPGNLSANLALAELATERGDFATARTLIAAAQQAHADDLRVALRLAELSQIEGDETSFISTLQAAIEAHPEALAARIMLARFFVERNDAARARAIVLGLQGEQAEDPRILEVLAWAQIAEGDLADALVTSRRLVGLRPDSSRANFLLGWAHVGLGDLDRARASLANAVVLDPDYVVARLYLARLLIAQNQVIAAKPHIEYLSNRAPDNPDVVSLIAAAESAGKATQGVPFSKSQSQLTEVLAVFNQRWGRGDKQAAVSLLRQQSEQNPSSRTLLKALAEAQLLLGYNDASAESFRRLIKLSGDDVSALNNLAWLIRNSEPEVAMTLARRAATLAPESVQIMDTMAMVYLANGQFNDALMLNEKTREREPGNPSLRFHQALILQGIGQSSRAQNVLEALLAADGDFAERKEALRLLARLLGQG